MRLLKLRLLSYLPTRLPLGLTEFYTWSQEIIDLAGPMADQDSMRFVLSTLITQLGSQVSTKPKIWFVRSLHKAAANQVASQVFQDIKVKQAEAAAKKLAEDTASKETVPSDGQKA